MRADATAQRDNPTQNSTLNSDFKDFAGLLNAHGVEYLLVGGYTLAAHGHRPRRIDLLTGVDGVEFAGCRERRETLEAEGLQLQLFSLQRQTSAWSRAADLPRFTVRLAAPQVANPAGKLPAVKPTLTTGDVPTSLG